MKLHNLLIVCLLALAGCSNNDIPPLSLGIDDSYTIARMQKLSLAPALTADEYRWMIDGSMVSRDKDYTFLFLKPGKHEVTFEAVTGGEVFKHQFMINVVHEEVEYSPYIARVHEYLPAPGQFINTMPQYEEGDTEADMIEKVQQCISGKNDVLISLGSFGGYVTFSFDHTCVNVAGEKDFRIWGNAFYEATGAIKNGGSAEPGIVMVAVDENGNGLPDDKWYELAGSEYNNPSTIHKYCVTYTKGENLTWTDNRDGSGVISQNSVHKQPYFPLWLTQNSYTLTGARLPDNVKDTNGKGNYYVLDAFGWGYVDNHPNDKADLCSFDISWAVDDNGQPVKLQGVDFIRVYSAMNQYCGWLGETSTELSKAMDLHI